MASEADQTKFIPAGVFSVTENTSIGECIKIMKKKNVGSLVVLDQQTGQSLVGVITERDIIRNFAVIARNQTIPVNRVMTADVITLPVGQLHKASELMLSGNFRHMFFTYNNKDGRRKIAGVASARDLLREYARGASTRLTPFASIASNIGLVTESDNSRRLFKGLFRKITDANLELYSIEMATKADHLKVIAKNEMIFIDIDHMPLANWVQLLKQLLEKKRRPKTLAILFTSSGFNKKTIDTLRQLAKSDSVVILEKPLNLSAVLSLLRTPQER